MPSAFQPGLEPALLAERDGEEAGFLLTFLTFILSFDGLCCRMQILLPWAIAFRLFAAASPEFPLARESSQVLELRKRINLLETRLVGVGTRELWEL